MPHIQNVPDRSEIEIHIGNYLTDTDGCVLLGNYFNGAVLMESRMAFDKFMEWFQSCGYTASLKITEETTPRPMETS